jgi:Nif-specific regulatory protein
MIERIVLLADKALLDERDVERFLTTDSTAEGLHAGSGLDAEAPVSAEPRPYAMATSHTRDQLAHALRSSGGNKSRAAQLLGLTERQFSYRWRKMAR